MTAAERLALRERAAGTRAESRTISARSVLLRRGVRPAIRWTQDDVLVVIKKKLIPKR